MEDQDYIGTAIAQIMDTYIAGESLDTALTIASSVLINTMFTYGMSYDEMIHELGIIGAAFEEAGLMLEEIEDVHD